MFINSSSNHGPVNIMNRAKETVYITPWKEKNARMSDLSPRHKVKKHGSQQTLHNLAWFSSDKNLQKFYYSEMFLIRDPVQNKWTEGLIASFTTNDT